MSGHIMVTDAWNVAVQDPSQVHVATAAATAAALPAGLDAKDTARCELLSTELATNLVKHAMGGRLLISVSPGVVQLVAVDSGPGIGDVAASMTDGFTTTSSLGAGLGACRRGAAQFDLYSRRGEGTVVLVRIGPAAAEPTGPVELGGVITPHPTETVIGDGYGLVWEKDKVTVGVVDGLGHGAGAAEARRAALEVLERRPTLDPVGLLREFDVRLRATRGAAASAAQLDGWSRGLAFAGLGNVSCRLFDEGGSQALVPLPGILGTGGQHRSQRSVSAGWRHPAMLVMHTDGITSRWDLAAHPGAADHHPAITAALIWRDANRDNDDATVVVVRTRPE